jgi:hypothetical protein
MPRVSPRFALLAVAVVAASVLVAPSGHTAAATSDHAAPAASGPVVTSTRALTPGAQLSTFQVATATGTATGDLVAVDLADRRVSVGLLHPPAVSAREPVSAMTASAHAVAGVNADFFDIDESQHPGVAATGSSDGPEIASGRALKAAVPNSQRFGPGLAPGTTTRDVIGVGVDGRARLDSLHLTGTVLSRYGRFPLAGLNQYAVAEGGIDAFTSDWGGVSRERSVCGSDTSRGAPCTTDTAEVTVRNGRVVAVGATPGAGAIAPHSTVLVGREGGAAELRQLHLGDPVAVSYRLAGTNPIPLRFAVGGAPILRDGATLPGVDAKTVAVRTGAGISRDGRHLYLVVLDGISATNTGLSLAELAAVLEGFGAHDGVNLDGGGSSTCAVKLPGSSTVTVVNDHPGGVAERPVANGIGVFAR